MIKSRLCDRLGIKYPIIQAGMGPFSNNNLCMATANAGVLGLLSTSGVFSKDDQPRTYSEFVRTGEADPEDGMATVLEKVLRRTYRLVKDKGGVFGTNVMVSTEVLPAAGEVAQRIKDIPRVNDLAQQIVGEAKTVLRAVPTQVLA